MRDRGFIRDVARSQFPDLAPVAGYAVTGRIRTGVPLVTGIHEYHRTDWWEYVASFPDPKIIVLQDVDHRPGTGAYFGEIHCRIAKALGCVAYVTNGTIRDLPELKIAQFQCFASGTSISHSYAGITDFGTPIEIGGLEISPGVLLHGDCHGVQTIPMSVAEELPEKVKTMSERENELIRLCESPDFTVEKLVAMLKKRIPAAPPTE